MVAIVFDRTDSGSIATILLGDTVVVRVEDGAEAGRWTVEASGLLTLDAMERVEADGTNPGERRLHFRATAVGESSLRLAFRGEDARVLDTFLLEVEVHEQLPSSALELLRKRR